MGATINSFRKNPKVFLATTANEEFWDQKEKIVFLQDGCKLFSRKHIWENLDHETFQYCLDTAGKIQTAYEVFYRVYDKALEALGKVLNQYHGIDKQTKYYKIILGPWLEVFTFQLYEKFLVLQEFKKSFPEFDTFLLPKDQHRIPLDLNDFYNKIRTGEEYNLQIYSQILEMLGHQFQYRELKTPLPQPPLFMVNCGITRRLFSFISSVQLQLNRALGRRTFVVTSPYSTKKERVFFIIKNRFKYILDEFLSPIKIPVKFDLQARDSMSMNFGDSEFEILLSKLLFRNLPFGYLEGFKEMRKSIEKIKIKKGDVYFTGTGLQGNLLYSFFIAENHRDITFLMHQHGVGYGMYSEDSVERLEREVTDRFYTWGWKGEKCRVLPHPKICRPCGDDRKADGDLVLVLEEGPRHTYRVMYRATGAAFLRKYIDPLFCFLDNIREDIDIAIRPHPVDQKWKVPSRIQNRYQGRTLKILTGQFKSAICGARICIHPDPVGTPFLETLAQNIPTIAIFDPNLHRFRSDAQKYFDGLIQAEIIHPDPKKAAEKLNKVFDNVGGWWNKPFVQEARAKFVSQFARTSTDWQADWRKEFDEVLEKGV